MYYLVYKWIVKINVLMVKGNLHFMCSPLFHVSQEPAALQVIYVGRLVVGGGWGGGGGAQGSKA